MNPPDAPTVPPPSTLDWTPAQYERFAYAMGRICAWCLEGKNAEIVGFRASVMVWCLRPDLVEGKSLAEIAAPLGYGRSAAHKVSEDFKQTFGVRPMLGRSEAARRAYRAAWAKAHPDGRRHTAEKVDTQVQV